MNFIQKLIAFLSSEPMETQIDVQVNAIPIEISLRLYINKDFSKVYMEM